MRKRNEQPLNMYSDMDLLPAINKLNMSVLKLTEAILLDVPHKEGVGNYASASSGTNPNYYNTGKRYGALADNLACGALSGSSAAGYNTKINPKYHVFDYVVVTHGFECFEPGDVLWIAFISGRTSWHTGEYEVRRVSNHGEIKIRDTIAFLASTKRIVVEKNTGEVTYE